MPQPETQLTVRITPKSLERLRVVQEKLAETAVVAPRESDLHRTIYDLGLAAIEARLGIGDAAIMGKLVREAAEVGTEAETTGGLDVIEEPEEP